MSTISARGRMLVLAAPSAMLLIATAVLVVSHGGYGATSWYPVALFILALLAVLVFGRAAEVRHWSPVFAAAVAAYAGYVAWSYLTIVWAQVPGLAWDAANRNLLYGMVLAIVAFRRWNPGNLRIAIGALAATILAIAIGLLVASSTSDPAHLFVEGRLSAPMGYSNATPNLWLIGCFPALWLACDRAVPWPLRGIALGGAGMLIELALVSQSRGATVAFAVAVVLFVAFSTRRWVALAALAVAVGATALAAGPILDVHSAVTAAAFGPLLADARTAIGWTAGALTVVGLLLALADSRAQAAGRTLGNSRRGNLALAGLTLAALVAGLVAISPPGPWFHARWTDFRTAGYNEIDVPGKSRLTGSLGSHRYDVYRVALDDFLAHPIGGIGGDNFGPTYLLHGRSEETPRYAHSLPMSLLAETGAVGTALFLAFLALLGTAIVRAARACGALRGPIVAATAGAVVFFVGALFDWLWQFPGLAVPALLLLGAAAQTRPGLRLPEPPLLRVQSGRSARPAALAAGIAGSVAAVTAALSFAAPGVAARFTSAAYRTAADDPQLAVKRLQRAADLDPLSADPLLAKGIILRRLGDLDGARAAFGEAVRRESSNWFAYMERGLVEAAQHRWAPAVADLRRATELNPRQPVVRMALRAASRRVAVPAAQAESALSRQNDVKLSPTA